MDKEIKIVIRVAGQKIHSVTYTGTSFFGALSAGLDDISAHAGELIDAANEAATDGQESEDND